MSPEDIELVESIRSVIFAKKIGYATQDAGGYGSTWNQDTVKQLIEIIDSLKGSNEALG